MKSKCSVRSSFIVLAVSTIALQISYSQTVEIDPSGLIPSTHRLVLNSQFNTNGDLEGWSANADFILENGTPSGGILTGTQGASAADPSLTRGSIGAFSSADTIFEFKITKDSSDTSDIDLFWEDDTGGFGGPRMLTIPTSNYPSDGLPHVVRITFSGQVSGLLSQIRFDPSKDAAGQNRSTSLDYFQVYSSVASVSIVWDPAITGGSTAGGSGTWNTSSTYWWDGSSQVAWPSTPPLGTIAEFGTTAGTVSLPALIKTSGLVIGKAGYVFNGAGPLTLEGDAIVRNTGDFITTLDVPLAGSTPITLAGGRYILKQAGTQTAATTVTATALGLTLDNPFGASSNLVNLGGGGNLFLSSLGIGTERTISNEINFNYNRLIIDSGDMSTGLPVLPLTLTGNVNLNLPAPGDIFMRRSLKITGVVSGTGAIAGIYLAGDTNTLTLSYPGNIFYGNIRVDNDSIIEATADGSLGDTSNEIRFNGGSGSIRLLQQFDSARVIRVTGSSAGRVRTNGFDSTWSGGIIGQDGVNSRFYKQETGTLTLGGSNFLGGGTQVRGGTLRIPAGASLTHGNTWDNSHGVSGTGTLLLDGGNFTINASFYGVGNGTAPTDEAVFRIDSGTYTHNGGAVLVGFRGNGRFILNGGIAVINQLNYGDGDATRTAITELNGGTLTMDTAGRRGGDAVATIKLNGTTLIPKSNKVDFLPTGTAGSTSFLVGTGGAKFNTSGFDIGILSSLQHDVALATTKDGGLSKSGAGILNLGAANTYTGDTTITEGTLTLAFASLNDSSTVSLSSSAVLNLNHSGTDAVGGLILSGVSQPNGVYDSTNSGGQITGSGKLRVGPALSGGFENWATLKGIPNEPANGDFDHDGLANIVEYALGLDPKVSSVPPGTFNGATISFTKGPEAITGADVNYIIETSTDLGASSPWAAVVTQAAPDSTTTISYLLPKTGPRLFARLKIVQIP